MHPTRGAQRQAKADGHLIEELSGALTLRDARLADLDAQVRLYRPLYSPYIASN